jgi:hypothetical protein
LLSEPTGSDLKGWRLFLAGTRGNNRQLKRLALFSLTAGVLALVLPDNARTQVSFPGPELLGRPETGSITINVVPSVAIEAYFQYGTRPGGENFSYPTAGALTPLSTAANQPLVAVIANLAADTQYYYRLVYRQTGSSSWIARPEHSFHTARRPGEAFEFTVTSDSHIGIVFGNASLFRQTMRNVADDEPDLHFDLGDTFAMDGVTTQAAADRNYLSIRTDYFSQISASVPIFLVLGNHEQEEGWHLTDTNNAALSPPILSANARNNYYINPDPLLSSFYTGNTDTSNTAITSGSDHTIQDYYAFTWGDALFVAIDPYWYTSVKPYSGDTGGGEPGYPTEAQLGDADRWRWTIGPTQYQWLKQTLEHSTAKYKFVFAHQVPGGSNDYGRGGAYAAPYVELGGENIDGTWGFDSARAQKDSRWDIPIHPLFVKTHVTAFFHGHDHEYAHEERDGVVYQLVPMAADASYGYGFEYYRQGGRTLKVLPNSGHLRVSVNPDTGVTVKYVRAFLADAGLNRSIADSYTIPPVDGNVRVGTTGRRSSFPVQSAGGASFNGALAKP